MVAHTYIALPPIVDIRFQFLFHSPPGVLFTFPSRYLFTIGHQLVFSFTQWSGQIPTEFHVLRGTWVLYYHALLTFRLQDFHPLWLPFPEHSTKSTAQRDATTHHPYNPASRILQRVVSYTAYVLSSSRFAHHYSGNHIRFLFLALLRCFSSCRSLPYPIYSDKDVWPPARRVSPFGHLRIIALLAAPRSFQQPYASFFAF